MVLTDESIYQQFLSGDRAALRTLVERHREGLILFVYGYVGNMDDAEDLQMETFAALLCGDARFPGKGSFKAWLYGVARNQARIYLRRKAIHARAMDKYRAAPQGDLPEISLVHSERNRLLYAALSRLPRDYRQVLILTEMDGMSAEEAGQAMHKTRAQVYHLVSRGKKALRETLEGMGYDAQP
ncbi:MAG: RNA polymerase sigma factor [Clostridia bacterium]|nr:RNA polymerase sigma factor [Clostridia bacterium]MBQ6326621.1 RNA polymerase sigma factor [Clostridia bacterium]